MNKFSEINLQNTFLHQGIEDWEKSVMKDLKGKSPHELIRKNYDGFLIKPIYSVSDLDDNPLVISEYPGFFNYLRGFNPDGNVNTPWLSAQYFRSDNLNELRTKISDNIRNGLNSVLIKIKKNNSSFQMNGCRGLAMDDVSSFLNSFYGVTIVLYCESNPEDISQILTGLNQKLNVIVEADIFAGLFTAGVFEETLFNNLEKLSRNIIAENLVALNGTPVINAGGNSVQELAVILSMAAEVFNRTEIDENRFTAIIAMDSDFFTNIAKVRALRVLWANLLSDAGMDSSAKLIIHAHNTTFNKSILDEHNNILRAATETFSAALSDCDIITTMQFDLLNIKSTELADRIAKNTQFVISLESHTGRVIDPLGGSYYTESLTNELVESAWSMFIDIENIGGLISACKSGFLNNRIHEVAKKKFDDFNRAELKITGVNFSPDANDKFEGLTVNSDISENRNEKICEPLTFKRLSEDFEYLRYKLSKTTHKSVFIFSVGELKEYKQRTEFISKFLVSGGFIPIINSNTNDFHNSISELKSSGCNTVIFSSSNDRYESDIPGIIADIGDNYNFVLCGKPEQIQAKEIRKYIMDFLYPGCNLIEKITRLGEITGALS